MPFISETRVLTGVGTWKAVSQIRVGDILPTPLGPTRVNDIGYFGDSNMLTFLTNGLVLFAHQRLLHKSRTFQYVHDDVAYEQLLRLGFQMDPKYGLNTWYGDEILSLSGGQPRVDYMASDTPLRQMNAWMLSTENGIFVVEDCVTKLQFEFIGERNGMELLVTRDAKFRPNMQLFKRSGPDPEITSTQIEEFKNEYFQSNRVG